MKIWLKRISIVLLVTLVLFNICVLANPPESKNCSICGHLKCHAPCILNLSTGEIGELELYQPHYGKVGEIAEEQTGGTFSFIYPAGLQGIRMTDPWYIEVNVPIDGKRKNISFFCEMCQKLLNEYQQGYVLIDLYNLDDLKVFTIKHGAVYDIRCYRISVVKGDEKRQFDLFVKGMLN